VNNPAGTQHLVDRDRRRSPREKNWTCPRLSRPRLSRSPWTCPRLSRSPFVSPDRIKNGVKFPHRNDGTIFKSREGLLPSKPAGYWTKHVHPTLGGKGPGLQRIVKGQNGEIYFTPDHYKTFRPLNPNGGAW